MNMATRRYTSVGVFIIIMCSMSSTITTLQYMTMGDCNTEEKTKTKMFGCVSFNMVNCILCILCMLKVFGVYHLF